MKIHHLSVDETLASLHSKREGLSATEAAWRLKEYGENRIERGACLPLWRRLLKKFVHFFALILWLAATLAFFFEWRDPGEVMAALGYATLGVILINGVFSSCWSMWAPTCCPRSPLAPSRQTAAAVRPTIAVCRPDTAHQFFPWQAGSHYRDGYILLHCAAPQVLGVQPPIRPPLPADTYRPRHAAA